MSWLSPPQKSYETIAEESIAFFHLSEKLFETKQIDQNVPPIELSWNRELQNCNLSLNQSGLIGTTSQARITKDDYYKRQKKLAKLLQETKVDSTANFSMDVEAYVISTAHKFAQQDSEFRCSRVYQDYIAIRKRIGRNFRINKNLQELRLQDRNLLPNGRNGQRYARKIGPNC